MAQAAGRPPEERHSGAAAWFSPLRATARRRRRLALWEALLFIAAVTATAVLGAGALVVRTDGDQFHNFGVGLWWAITTITTVGYGDVVPTSAAGRVLGAGLMLVGIASLAFLTAIAASAIVIGEVAEEEHEIEKQEGQILDILREIDARLERLEHSHATTPASPDTQRTGSAHDIDQTVG